MPLGLLRRIVVTAQCIALVYTGLVFLTLLLRRWEPQMDWLVEGVDEHRFILAFFIGLGLANAVAPLAGF